MCHIIRLKTDVRNLHSAGCSAGGRGLRRVRGPGVRGQGRHPRDSPGAGAVRGAREHCGQFPARAEETEHCDRVNFQLEDLVRVCIEIFVFALHSVWLQQVR